MALSMRAEKERKELCPLDTLAPWKFFTQPRCLSMPAFQGTPTAHISSFADEGQGYASSRYPKFALRITITPVSACLLRWGNDLKLQQLKAWQAQVPFGGSCRELHPSSTSLARFLCPTSHLCAVLSLISLQTRTTLIYDNYSWLGHGFSFI
jgi:hypothetical protein